jgi:excisionase family DNA binding protein
MVVATIAVMNSSAAKPQQAAAPAPKPEQIRDEVRRVYAESFANEAAAPARLNNVEQVQGRLGVGRSTVFELIATNKLRSVKVGRRRLVPESALAALCLAAVLIRRQGGDPPRGRRYRATALFGPTAGPWRWGFFIRWEWLPCPH